MVSRRELIRYDMFAGAMKMIYSHRQCKSLALTQVPGTDAERMCRPPACSCRVPAGRPGLNKLITEHKRLSGSLTAAGTAVSCRVVGQKMLSRDMLRPVVEAAHKRPCQPRRQHAMRSNLLRMVLVHTLVSASPSTSMLGGWSAALQLWRNG
jgi:hypothetical protein